VLGDQVRYREEEGQMRSFGRHVMATLALLVVLLLLPSLAAASPTSAFDAALDQVYGSGYPQSLEDFFTSQGTNPDLGFRWAGTAAERAVIDKVVRAFRLAGLSGVTMERVPVDVFDFKHAGVVANGHDYLASAAGGPPPTGPDGITAELVYVGDGSKAAFDAAEEASGPVAGKLVLVDVNLGYSYYANMLGAEAEVRGAAGVITSDSSGYLYADDAIGLLFESYQYSWPPMVYIAKADGDVLRAEVQAAMDTHQSYQATLTVDTQVTRAKDGGHSYNVIGVLPGRSHGQAIVLSAHTDANFWTGMDDAAALANMLAMLRAMHRSGYQPAHDIIFFTTTGEEFGRTNTWFDYLAGSWYASTHTHKDWGGKIRAIFNLELMGMKDAKLALQGSEELTRVFEQVAARNPDLTPYGTDIYSPVNSWTDSFPFAAEGVPAVEVATANAEYWTRYHTTYETKDLVDFDYLAKIGKFIFRAQRALDRGLLPYDFTARAAAVDGAVEADPLLAAGADPDVVKALENDIAAFSKAAAKLDAARADIQPLATANVSLLQAAAVLNDKLTALDTWGYTCYPHQQVLKDLEKINVAIGELEKTPVDKDAATAPLWDVSQMYYGLTYDYAAFVANQARYAPGYSGLYWGAQGQLAPQLDLVADYYLIQAGYGDVALVRLKSVRDAETALLNRRLMRVARVLETVTPMIKSVL
jgi:hypothetical protein